MTAASKRERLFTAVRRTIPVTLSTGDVVEVRPLSMLERNKLAKDCTADGEVDTEKLCPALLIACTFDPETDEPLFTIGDREALGALPANEVDDLWMAAATLNGFGKEPVKAAEKN